MIRRLDNTAPHWAPGALLSLASALLMAAIHAGCDTASTGHGQRGSSSGGAAAPRGVATPKPAGGGLTPERGVAVVWNSSSRLTLPKPGEVWVFHRGRRYLLPEAEATRQGFTILNLGDDWTPILFTERSGEDAHPVPFPYRKRYLDLANDRTDHRGRRLPKGRSNYLELYGIPPTPSVLRRRLGDRRIRRCYSKVDRDALKKMRGSISAWGFSYAVRKARALRRLVRRKLRRRGWRRDQDLRRLRGGRRLLRRLRRAELRSRAARAALAVLRCERLLPARGRRPPGDQLYKALTAYERKHSIVGRGVLNRAVARSMSLSPDEADALALRRVIRERVVHTAAIIEDGSARRLKRTYIAGGRRRELPNLVEQFANAALEALGLTSPATVRAFLLAVPAPVLRHLHVAVRLPPRPAYYSQDMDLEVIINRGDVYYDPPIDADGKRRSQYRGRTPRLTLYVRYRGQRIPLVHWRTTVGGWRDEIKDGQVYLKYKPSDVGPRVWRDIIAAPVWIPPPSTPPREIVRGRHIKTENMGPGYLSAYGLVAALHLIPRRTRKGLKLWDKGIRTHGSYNYRSIRAGYSHGCHRLYNHKAIRLFSFILGHRPFERVGLEPYPYLHRFEYKGRRYKIKVDNRGYVYRLRRLLPVTVTRGRVLGKLKRPIRDYIKKPGVKYEPDGGAPATTTDDGGAPATTPTDGGAEAVTPTDGGVPRHPPAASRPRPDSKPLGPAQPRK